MRVPFYYFQGKPFCYLYRNKTAKYPYVAIVRADKISNPLLEKGTRKKMKVLSVNPLEDIPVHIIYAIFDEVREEY